MTSYCCDVAREWQEAYDAWFAKWPNACRKCTGWGETGGRYDRETGEWDGDVCACVDALICPRCGDLLGSENGPCARCGWDWNDKHRGGPTPVACDCVLARNVEEIDWEN